MADESDHSDSSTSDESFVNDVQENRNGLQAYQFEPRRRDDSTTSSSDNSESEESSGDETEGIGGRMDTLDWCTCGHCSTEHLSRYRECFCCQESARTRAVAAPTNADTSICVTNNGDFTLLCLTPVVLRNVMVALNNVRADHWNVNPANNRGLRYAAYRQFTWWAHERLGPGRRRVVPACATHAIRQAFPKDPDEEYIGFHSGEDSDDET